MKKILLKVICVIFIIGVAKNVEAHDGFRNEIEVVKANEDSLVVNKKEEKNRNVMKNAESSTSPRSVNIGLPFRGDILILENDVPVVYWFWPTVPTVAWRYDNSLSNMGLLSFSESALTFGKVGFTVKSSDREASRKFKGYATIYGNSFGSSRYDMTVTGPIKKGWGYTFSGYQSFDRGNGINYMYTDWYEKTSMFKAGLQKDYKDGSVRVLYKYADSKSLMSNYMPLMYDGYGATSELDNFRLGRDSYVVRDGLVPYFDPYTGESKQADLTDDKFSRSVVHTLYLSGNHKFNNGWKLNYSSMYQKANSPIAIQVPISVMLYNAEEAASFMPGGSFTYHGTNTAYDGSVQFVLNQLIPQSDVTSVISRVELTKQVKNHNLRFGLSQQYNHTKYTTLTGMYLQTVEANPQMLDYTAYYGAYQMTNEHGGLPVNFSGYGGPTDFTDNKVALYFSDDIKATNWLSFGFGARIENFTREENRNVYTKEYIGNKPLVNEKMKNKWNKVAIGDFVLNITKEFGLLGDVTYNGWSELYWDYPYKDDNGNPVGDPSTGDLPRQSVAKDIDVNVLNYGAGVFLNLGTKLSVVSKVTSIKKENVQSNSANITDPSGSGERANFDPIFYDIETLGWSTDILFKPTKNFTLHYLLTLQDPQFKNYSYGAFGVNYNYNNNTIPELSKTLMEIDPSYTFMKGALRLWFSLRYFGEQYANATNEYYYDARWENFGGIDYRLSRNAQIKLQVTNFLDQKGVKGQMQGADQITDDRFVNHPVVAGAIRPRTVELSLNLKF